MSTATSSTRSNDTEAEVMQSPAHVAAPEPAFELPKSAKPEPAQAPAIASDAQPAEPDVSVVDATERDQRPSGGSHSAADGAGLISEFVPAHTNVVGARALLDALPDRAAAATVREQLLDVIETEGPIELARLTRIVARRFGLNTVRAARADDIARLVPRGQLKKGRLGSFAWPANLDPAEWTGFRHVDADAARSLDEVAPEEIANAMLAVQAEYPGASDEDTLRRTAELFGILRLGANVRSRLDAVYKKLPSETPAPVAPLAGADATVGLVPGPAADIVSPRATPQQTPTVPTSLPTAEVSVARPPDPVIDRLVGDAAAYVPDLSRVPSEFYYDYATDRPLTGDLIHLVNSIVVDPEYAGLQGHKGVVAWTRDVSVDDAHAVGNLASMLWSQSYGEEWAQVAEKIAVHLARDPEFEPLPWYEDINRFVASRMAGIRPGLVAVVQNQLNIYAHAKGLVARLEEELQREARAALSAMTALDRDIYGFTSRNAKRLQLADPYISRVKESRRRFVVYWMSRFEGEESGLEREARYATAVRRLAAQGQTRAAISRMLGVSTSVMDRIERENRTDVPLSVDDPILTDLAPSLR